MRHSTLSSALLAAALAVGAASLASAQGPMPSPQAASPAQPGAAPSLPSAAQSEPSGPPASEPRSVKPRDVSVVSGSRFRVGQERYQVLGVRTPRPRGGQCVMERLRGRQSRAALRRILSHGDIRIQPTGQINALGDKIARVWVDGHSVARRLINARAAVARRQGESFNPWCISLRRPPA